MSKEMMVRRQFVYCPYCATALEEREVYRQRRPVCPACGFVHFQDPKVAVIAFVTHKERVLLVQRAIDPGKGQWALPGGYMDADEMPEAALQRELLEEVNLAIQIDRLLTIFPIVTAPGRGQGIVLAYQATPADAKATKLTCDDDVSAADWFTADRVPANLAFESTHVLLAHWREQLN
ncbi:MAG: NUDIX hydrolase [Caldilineaceae bacterium]